jgi:hypothetical protein
MFRQADCHLQGVLTVVSVHPDPYVSWCELLHIVPYGGTGRVVLHVCMCAGVAKFCLLGVCVLYIAVAVHFRRGLTHTPC